jgi:hypothetical protein
VTEILRRRPREAIEASVYEWEIPCETITFPKHVEYDIVLTSLERETMVLAGGLLLLDRKKFGTLLRELLSVNDVSLPDTDVA